MLHFCPFLFRHSPAIPELDFAGTIVEVGPQEQQVSESVSLLDRLENRGLVVGAQVFGSIGVPEHVGGGYGTLGEYVIVDADYAVKKPTAVSPEEISGVSVTGCTALPAVESAQLKRGDSVLVNGASGGIGTLVVQMAKKIVGDSGKVVGICSGRNIELVRSLGADEVSRT